eukprot:768578-Hanusia_phi.AAC.5
MAALLTMTRLLGHGPHPLLLLLLLLLLPLSTPALQQLPRSTLYPPSPLLSKQPSSLSSLCFPSVMALRGGKGDTIKAKDLYDKVDVHIHNPDHVLTPALDAGRAQPT